jgi:hypothetical protein
VFSIKIVKTYHDALSRQIGEAIHIELGANVLNSKAEFSCSRLARLVVDRSWMTDQFRLLEEDNDKKYKTERAGVLEADGVAELNKAAVKGTKSQPDTQGEHPAKKKRSMRQLQRTGEYHPSWRTAEEQASWTVAQPDQQEGHSPP